MLIFDVTPAGAFPAKSRHVHTATVRFDWECRLLDDRFVAITIDVVVRDAGGGWRSWPEAHRERGYGRTDVERLVAASPFRVASFEEDLDTMGAPDLLRFYCRPREVG